MSTFYNSLDFTISLELSSRGKSFSENHSALRKDLAQGLFFLKNNSNVAVQVNGDTKTWNKCIV